MKKLLLIVFIYNSMGFATVSNSGVTRDMAQVQKTVQRPRVLIEIASPNSEPVTIRSSGNF